MSPFKFGFVPRFPLGIGLGLANRTVGIPNHPRGTYSESPMHSRKWGDKLWAASQLPEGRLGSRGLSRLFLLTAFPLSPPIAAQSLRGKTWRRPSRQRCRGSTLPEGIYHLQADLFSCSVSGLKVYNFHARVGFAGRCVWALGRDAPSFFLLGLPSKV